MGLLRGAKASPPMLYNIMSTVLGLLCVSTVAQSNTTVAQSDTTTKAPTYEPCKFSGSLDDRAKTLNDAYSSGELVDLIFIVDRSKSIKSESFRKSVDFISSLIQTQVSSGQLTIHPDYARISLLSFGRELTIDVDGIGYSLFDACVFENRLSAVQLDSSSETRPTQALEAARDIFLRSERAGQAALKRVMWVFSDGDFRNEERDNGTQSRNAIIQELRGMNVEMFVAGIGRPNEGWLNNKEKEENLKSLATDVLGHYLCVEEWQKVVDSTATGSPSKTPEAAEQTAKIYGLPLKSDLSDCKECRSDREEKCACEVTNAVYECFDCSKSNADHPQYGNVCPPRTTPAGDATSSDEDDTDWLMYAIIGACALGLLLLIAIVVCCCLLKRRKRRREENEKSFPGPELPPPPVPPRRKQKDQYILAADPAETDMYANTMDLKRMGDGGSDRRGKPIDSVYDTGFDPPSKQTELTYEYEQIEENENEMPGWGAYLHDLKTQGELVHLGVHSTRNKRWAFTSGFRLSPNEVKALDTAFRQGQDYQGSQVKVGGHRYALNKSEASELQLRGKRPRKIDGRMVEESVWVVKSGDYVIAGVGASENDSQISNAVFELYRHLAGQDMPADEN